MKISSLEYGVAALLEPREGILWPAGVRTYSIWERSVLIENAASRFFWTNIIEQEAPERAIIRDGVENVILRLPSARSRSWMAEYDFMAKMLGADQLVIYAPALVQLAHLMPNQLKQYRRKMVARFLKRLLPLDQPFVMRQMRKFVRSSVLLYSSNTIFEKAEMFAVLVKGSADQSARANKHRVATIIRMLQLMTNDEIVRHFKTVERYLTELDFLEAQCKYYRIYPKDIYEVSVLELRQALSG